MTTDKATTIVVNLAFCIAIWFAVPIVLPVAATLGWVLIVLNGLFSIAIAVGIAQAYRVPQE